MQKVIADLNSIYKSHSGLWQRDVSAEGFQWLVGDDGAGNTLAFVRWSDDGKPLVSVTNFSPVPHENYRLPLPCDGRWNEILNTDDVKYGGSGVTNAEVSVLHEEAKGLSYSALVRVPPLGTVWFALN